MFHWVLFFCRCNQICCLRRRGSFFRALSNQVVGISHLGTERNPPIQDKTSIYQPSMLQSLPFFTGAHLVSSKIFLFHYLMIVGAVCSQVCLLLKFVAVSNHLFCPCLALPMASWVFQSKVSKLEALVFERKIAKL